ncbi:hypothetical protein HK100_007178 [Physocladia obscura]|uniref:Uncharacterized protein n=1 Tax=Physocladia obscura TaxID=109957 RepID=A0AAD5XAY5_9FUNG|nr:hypothetical protein HK100_007178 [Physocladia obscura]
MGKSQRYTPLVGAGVGPGNGNANTYSSIQAGTATTAGAVLAGTGAPGATGTAGTRAGTTGPAPPYVRSAAAVNPAARHSPFYCSCAPALGALVARRLAVLFPSRTKAVGYLSGALFAFGWWLFIDGLVFASTRVSDDSPPIRFEHWLPGILSTLSLIIVNLIDKDSLNADDFSYAGSNVACKARACAFIGITMAMGALGGGFAILALKYLMPGLSGEDIYFGVMIALQNILIFVGSMTLWFGRNSGEDGYAESYAF